MSEESEDRRFLHLQYPSSKIPILESFKSQFEAVYVAFHPFYRIPDLPPPLVEELLSLADFKKKVKRRGIKISWEEMRKRVGFEDLAMMNTALLTNIGALRRKYTREDEAKTLSVLCENEDIYLPDEGFFQEIMDTQIIEAFHIAGHDRAVFMDEFGRNLIELEFSQFNNELCLGDWTSCREGSDDPSDLFIPLIIFSPDENLMVIVDWDSFFTLICARSRETLAKIVDECSIEGFYCSPSTRHYWSL